MARRGSPTPRYFERNPNVYARTTDTYTSRYYHRKQDPLFDLIGLSTAPDDFHKQPGSSPHLANARYMGEREEDQRAQVMSRKGAKLVGSIGEDIIGKDPATGDAYLEIHEGKAIEYEILHNKRLVGMFLHLYNKERATGYLKITIRDVDTKRELANAVINSEAMSTIDYFEHEVRFIQTVVPTRVLVRIEVLDDVDNTDDAPEYERRSIRILSTTSGNHRYANYELPNTNEALEEIPYTFTNAHIAPLTGIIVNDWETMPRSEEFVHDSQPYIIFPVRRDGLVELYRSNTKTDEVTFVTALVDKRATAVRFAQAEGYLYYVDGYSPLRRINLTTLVAEDAVPKQAEITVPDVTIASLTAKVGGSLIHFKTNRLYVSGFKDDPNLVIVTLIDDIKPRFDQFNDRFYSPDQSPERSAGNPITALGDASDYMIVWRQNDLSLYSAGSGYEAGGTSQITPEGAALGVLNQEAVAQGKNNVFFFNPVEGVVRFGGSVNRNISGDIENLIKKIKHPESVFMLYQNKRLHVFFSYTEKTPDSRFYYYTELEGRNPWYFDNNTPISSAVANKKTGEIFAMHSQVAALMNMDQQFTDFDSIIKLEYNTQYRVPSTASPDGWCYVRRIHVHEIANSTHSLYVGLDIDHKDKPIVWRRYVRASVDPAVNPDAVFQHTAEPGNVVISIPMYVKARRYQVRIVRYCYKDTAEVMGVSVEYDNKDAL